MIHSTAGKLSKESIEGYKKKGIRGKAHAYIEGDGNTIELWPVTERNVWATKTEKKENNPESKGLMVHVELVTARGESPSDEQYEALANYYIEANEKLGTTLTIVPHKEVDRGIPSGHSDPEGFDFNKLYAILEKKGVDLSNVQRISQDRYLVPNQADQKHSWPPVLSGKPVRK